MGMKGMLTRMPAAASHGPRPIDAAGWAPCSAWDNAGLLLRLWFVLRFIFIVGFCDLLGYVTVQLFTCLGAKLWPNELTVSSELTAPRLELTTTLLGGSRRWVLSPSWFSTILWGVLLSLPNPLTSYLYRPESNSAHLLGTPPPAPPPWGSREGVRLEVRVPQCAAQGLTRGLPRLPGGRGEGALSIEGWRWRVSLCNGWRVEVECRA